MGKYGRKEKITFDTFYIRALQEYAKRLCWANQSRDDKDKESIIYSFYDECSGIAKAIALAGYDHDEFLRRGGYAAAKRRAVIYGKNDVLDELRQIYGDRIADIDLTDKIDFLELR